MNKKIKSFENLNVWIIGASSGIGRALTIELIKLGANLYISSRKKELLDEIKCLNPNRVEVLPLDVLDVRSIDAAFKEIKQLDLVIYLAADYTPMPVSSINVEWASRIIDVNLKGAINVASAVLPRFIQERRGHISFIASIAGYIGLPQSSIYGATKAGLINFCESIYGELKDYNVDVSVVNPGFVKTNLTAKNSFDMPFIMTPEEAAKAMLKGFAQGRFDIVFPKVFSYFFRFLRLLPYPLHLKLAKILVKA